MIDVDNNFKKHPWLTIIGWLVIIALLILVCVTCTPIRRLERLQQKHPYLFNRQNDTIKLKDTVYWEYPLKPLDTSMQLNRIYQPMGLDFYYNGIPFNLKGDTVTNTILVHAPKDTIRQTVTREIKVPYTKYVTEKIPFDWKSLFRWLWIPVVLIFGFYLFLRYRFPKR